LYRGSGRDEKGREGRGAEAEEKGEGKGQVQPPS